MLLGHQGSPLVGDSVVTTIVPGAGPLFANRNRQVLAGEVRQIIIGADSLAGPTLNCGKSSTVVGRGPEGAAEATKSTIAQKSHFEIAGWVFQAISDNLNFNCQLAVMLCKILMAMHLAGIFYLM